MTNVGIIDLGSNSVRISIVDIESGKTLYQGKNAIKLSEGMNKDMVLREEPIERCINALLSLCEVMKKFAVTQVLAVATAAVRKAENQREFLERIKKETGIEIRVLSGEEESEFDFLGVMGKTKVKDAVILDTGGGSMEIIGAKSGRMVGAKSIQIGSRSIKELFFDKGETDEAKETAIAKIKELIDELSWLDEFSNVPVIGIGGCNRTVARICLAEDTPDGPIESYTIEKNKVLEIFDKIEQTPIDLRGEINGITPDRTDIIYGGLLPLIILMEKVKSDSLIVTDGGLRDGIAEKLIQSHKKM